ncbi:MAG: hypothetical protein AAF678_02375 [Pseudomonadota bacterium]
MGPLRGGLTVAILTVAASPAHAEICATFRPAWDGAPVTATQETIALFGTPISLVLLLATAFAIRFRSAWGALTVFVGWSFAVAAVTFLDPTGGMRAAAASEGCVGSPSLYIAIVFALNAGMMLYLNKMVDKGPDG